VERIATLFIKQTNQEKEKRDKARATPSSSIHACIKKVEHDIINFNFNTAISAMMIFFNDTDWRSKINVKGEWEGEGFDQQAAEKFLILLHPFAPHLAEHCWQLLGHAESIQLQPWPGFDEKLAAGDTVTIAVQVNGKLRASLNVTRGTSDTKLQRLALNHDGVKKYLQDVKVQRVVVVKDKVVSIVTE
jgi:leucyl-tRNA synthetase